MASCSASSPSIRMSASSQRPRHAWRCSPISCSKPTLAASRRAAHCDRSIGQTVRVGGVHDDALDDTAVSAGDSALVGGRDDPSARLRRPDRPHPLDAILGSLCRNGSVSRRSQQRTGAHVRAASPQHSDAWAGERGEANSIDRAVFTHPVLPEDAGAHVEHAPQWSTRSRSDTEGGTPPDRAGGASPVRRPRTHRRQPPTVARPDGPRAWRRTHRRARRTMRTTPRAPVPHPDRTLEAQHTTTGRRQRPRARLPHAPSAQCPRGRTACPWLGVVRNPAFSW